MAGNSRRYGIASRGVHQGEYTLCTAQNMETCPNHVHGSHKSMDDNEYMAANEQIIEGMSTPRRMLSKVRASLSHTRAKRERAGTGYRRRIRRTIATAAIAACLVPSLAACGNNYVPSAEAQDNYSQSESSNDSNGQSSNDYSDELNTAKEKAKDLYNKTKDSVNEYRNSDEWKSTKERLKKTAGSLGSQLNSNGYSTGGTADSQGGSIGSFPRQVGYEAALQEMNNVQVAEAGNSNYNRDDYKHWVNTTQARNWNQASPCMNVRNAVIAAQGMNVQLSADGCKVVSGEVNDPYGALNSDGTTVWNVKQADVDHIVPLEYVNQHGGASWSAQRKQDYANDANNLILVSSRANRQKGSKGPSEWMPNGQSAGCHYVESMAGVLYEYGISVSRADYDKIVSTLQQCQANNVQ